MTDMLTLPTENSSSLVIDIPTSLLRGWIDSLTKYIILGSPAWSWHETWSEIKFGNNGFFSIALRNAAMQRDFEIEIRVFFEETPSFAGVRGRYRSSGTRFWTKTLKAGEVLYNECEELWSLLLLLQNGRLSANHMLVAAAFNRAITNLR